MTGRFGVVLLALIAIGGAGAYFFGGSRSQTQVEGMDRPVYFVCQNEACQNEFEMTMLAYAMDRVDGSPACPQCRQRDVKQASLCDACGGYVEHGLHASMPPTCPHCGHEFVTNVEKVRETQREHERQHSGG